MSTPTVSLPPSTSVRLRPGETFAERYVVEGVLGEGGMGAVYRVLDAELDEAIALKLLRPEWASAPQALERFRREVKLARRVTHPNVARTFDLGSYQGIRYLTMELVEGEPLSAQTGKGRRLSLAEALRVAAEVARGLSAAHAAGVVHRELKPDNVLLSRDGRVVITDFGIARLAEGANAGNATRTLGAAIGTPAYMAPEQVEGRELDGRADIYALGILLYEMLVGELPFVGDTVYALAAARLAGVVPDPRAKVPELPEGVSALVMRALSRRREERPDAQELLRRLETLRGARVDHVEGTRVPLSTPTTSTTLVTPSGPRAVAVVPPTEGGAVALDLMTAVGDAIARLRGVRVLTGTEGADLLVEGSLRTAGGKSRVRMRIVEAAGGAQVWAERFEGSAAAPFALEDDVVRGVTEAVKLRVHDESGRRGPSDPKLRDAYHRARTLYAGFSPLPTKEAIAILRDGLVSAPSDPWLLSALGAALLRQWILTGGFDPALVTEAEEVSLRALAIDGSIGETFSTIGILRLQFGETRAAVRAFQEALARSPLLAEAHEYLGRLLCECGYPDEGLRRLDLAVRLEPNTVNGHWERARTFALLGDRPRAEQAMARSLASTRLGAGQIFQRARLSMWWSDRQMAAEIRDDIPKADIGIPIIRESLMQIMDAAVRGEPLADQVYLFSKMVGPDGASPRQRAFSNQLATEFFCAAGRAEEAFAALSRGSELALIDVLWMDRCPPLALIRDDPRFAQARALVAARAAEALS
ncbi:MAG: protein kinase domain-containing protein [Polyangiales bacterium]